MGNLFDILEAHLNTIVSDMAHFLIPFGMREEMACFELCFTCTDAKLRHLEFSQLNGFE